MKTVAPCKTLTERCSFAERTSVKRSVKITSEPYPEMKWHRYVASRVVPR